jgi:hypothetical protein
MGHSSKFGYCAMRYGPMRTRKRYSKSLSDSCAMGQSLRLGYVLWALMQVLVVHHGPLVQDLILRYDRSAGFGYVLRAVAPVQLPECRITHNILKAFRIFRKGSDAKKVYVYISNNQDLYHQSLNPLKCHTLMAC